MTYYSEARHGGAATLWKKLGGEGDLTPTLQKMLALAESPIEADMLAWLCCQPHLHPCTFEESHNEALWAKECHGLIIPQAPIGRHRLDILIVVAIDSGIKLLGVECDGHAFHERTRRQIQRDKARDRELACLGVTMMRFTGSEIFANPSKCALEVLRAARAVSLNAEQGVH